MQSTCESLDYVNPIATKMAMGANACHILKYGPNKKWLCGLFMIQKAKFFLGPIIGAYAHNRTQYALLRSEEIAADQYAFERASTQSLKAFDRDVLSLAGSLKVQNAGLDMELEGIARNRFISTQLKIVKFIQKIGYKYSMMHDLLDPKHPCDRDRCAAIAAELKRRGE